MKLLAAIIASASAALVANTDTAGGPLGSNCNPRTKVASDADIPDIFGGDAANVALLKAEAEANDKAAAVVAKLDADKAVDGDLWTVAFSAGDAVCKTVSIDLKVRTTANSPAGGNTAPTSASATTCTGGWTAWTEPTKWTVMLWPDSLAGSVLNTQLCYTVLADVGTNLDKAIESDLIIDTYTTAGSEDKTKVDSTKKVTVKTSTGLAGSSLLLWLFIILLLGGGGGAAYYFMVIAPTM